MKETRKYKIRMNFVLTKEFDLDGRTLEEALTGVEEWIYDEWHNEVMDADRELIVTDITQE